MTDQASERTDDDLADVYPADPSDGSEEVDRARREALLEDSPEEIAGRAPGRVETGHPDVDAVIGSLESLDAVPVDEHVAVFEQAHEELRRTLSGAGDDR
ncbi:MAG TPA: hypothetical protein VFE15_07870 [Marmoricola sp.]|jgi:hypothetical protein|nr:hypothetical protein [Marmoricola sp.]